MGKGDKDNFKVRKNRGKVAFQKRKKKVRGLDRYHLRCIKCSAVYKIGKVINGLCPVCRKRMGILD